MRYLLVFLQWQESDLAEIAGVGVEHTMPMNHVGNRGEGDWFLPEEGEEEGEATVLLHSHHREGPEEDDL